MDSEWIEINLPWYVYDDISDPNLNSLEYPNLDTEIKKIFGCTAKDKELQLFGSELLDSKDWADFSKLRDAAERKSSLELPNATYEEKKEATNQILLQSTHPVVKRVFEYREFKNKIDDWYYSHPEVLKIIEENDRRRKTRQEIMSKKSFCGMGLNTPGTLIEVEIAGILTIELIGSINTSCGVCGDCSAFGNDTIVKRYKKVHNL